MGVFTGLPFIATCFSGDASAPMSPGEYRGIAVEGTIFLALLASKPELNRGFLTALGCLLYCSTGKLHDV